MNRILLIFILLSSFHFFGQKASDSLLLVFHSDFEKSNFEKVYQEENDNFVEALLSIDSTITIDKSEYVQGLLDNFLNGIKKKVDSYSPKKKVKFVFNKIHDRFFKKYELNAYFSDIFNSGTYNCVSGTALYAYVFDFLSVPYQIKETPTHVFLVAYPSQYNIYVETTLPGKAGSFAPSEPMVKKAVDELVGLKLITRDHVSSVGYNKAYNDYFYGDGNITKKDLIGIQYYNKGVFFLNDENYASAFENMSKSKMIYQNKKTRLFSEVILSMLIDKTDFDEVENFRYLVEYAKIGNDLDYLKYKVNGIVSNKNWSEAELDEIEKNLNSIDSEDIRKALLEVFFSGLAQKFHKTQNTKKALLYANRVYEINKENIDARNYIASVEIERLAQKNLTAIRLDDLGQLITKYPFIENFDICKRYMVYLYSFLVTNEFSNNRSLQGTEYLVGLEKILNADEDDGIGFNQQHIGNAYAAVGAYYYRIGQKENARKYLKSGLQYSPDNENIKRKLRLMQNSY